MAISGSSLATSLGINGGICIIAVIIFSVLRVKAFTRKFYMPKRFDPEVERKPRQLPGGSAAWIQKVLFYPEDEIIHNVGLDVAVFLRLLAYGWVLFAFCTLWCCIAIMPINGTAGFLNGELGTNTTSFTDLDLLSASNVPPGDPRFWMHMISVYVITIFALLLLLAYSKDVSRLRAKYMTTMPRGGTTHTVLVTDIPGLSYGTLMSALGKATAVVPAKIKEQLNSGVALGVQKVQGCQKKATDQFMGTKGLAQPADVRAEPLSDDVLDPWADAIKKLQNSDVKALVESEMRDVYGDSHVACVNVVYNTNKLDPLMTKYDQTKTNLTDITDDYLGKIKRSEDVKKRKQTTLLPALAPAWAKQQYQVGAKSVKVDSLEYFPNYLDHLKADMENEKHVAVTSFIPAAFVTFNDRYTQTSAATGMHSHDETCWRVQAAPAPDEIIWKNLGMRYWQRRLRSVGMWALFIAIILFYLPLTFIIQTVANLDNARKVPGLDVITRIPFVTQVLQGILPGLVLKVFLAILPPILNMMNRYSGMVSESQVDFGTVSKYFIFQTFATFLFQFLVGSVLSNISAIVDQITIIVNNPAIVVQILGVGAPQQATFFMSFVMINALAVGLGLLRIIPLVIFIIRSKLAGTERAKYRVWAKQTLTFGTYVATHTMTILLGLCFCCLSPLIAPFCLLYFTLAILAQKYQLVYVFSHPYEACGRLWISCFHQIMTGIYFMQIVVMAVLLVKKFVLALLIIPAPIMTALFHVVLTNLFNRPWTLMSLKEAAVLDKLDGNGDVTPEEAAAISAMYVNPVFKLPEDEHNQVISEAKQVDQRLRGENVPLHIKDMEYVDQPDGASTDDLAVKHDTASDQRKLPQSVPASSAV